MRTDAKEHCLMSKRSVVDEREGVRPSIPLSYAVRDGNFVFVSGQVPSKAAGGKEVLTEEEIRQALTKLTGALGSVGATTKDVVKVNAYLADVSDGAAFNKVYEEFFVRPFPTRTTICARLLGGARFEVDCIAITSAED